MHRLRRHQHLAPGGQLASAPPGHPRLPRPEAGRNQIGRLPRLWQIPRCPVDQLARAFRRPLCFDEILTRYIAAEACASSQVSPFPLQTWRTYPSGRTAHATSTPDRSNPVTRATRVTPIALCSASTSEAT